MMDPAEETHSPELYRVSVRLQPFWPERPIVWFGQAEAQFELASITRQRTKFNYVVFQLNPQQPAEVEDLIASPPEHEPYDRLKAELVRRLSTSREQRVRRLLSHEEMGDRKTSQFLRHLKTLAFLAGHTEGSLDSASQLVDKICEVFNQSTTAIYSHATPDTTAELLGQIKELTRQIASLRTSLTHGRSQSRGRHRSHSRDDRSNPDCSRAPHDVCWYHKRFGNEARKCIPPCSRQQRDSRQQENSTSGR
jgi:hypothetical protein